MENEKRLIDATSLECWLDGGIHGAEVNGNAPTVNLYDVLTYLYGMPTVAAVEVVHARWIDVRQYCGDYMCSNCKELSRTKTYNYCPGCGAKMDGGNEDGC